MSRTRSFIEVGLALLLCACVPLLGCGGGGDDGSGPTGGRACTSDAACDDGNPCTADICGPATGICSNPPAPDGTACDDGNACTAGDACRAGSCTAGPCAATGPAHACCSDPVCAEEAVCQPAACATDAECDDGNPCTADTCDRAAARCSNAPRPDGTACSDGDVCTTGDSCVAGSCTAGACAATGPLHPCCRQPVCSGEAVCAPAECTADQDCDDGNPCTSNVCNPLTRTCSNPARPNGTACDDGNLCTTGDACRAGACTGTAVICTAPGPCYDAGTCDPSTGICSNPPSSDGTACNDGNPCTTGDACRAGSCTGTAVVCNDGNPCTNDSCDPGTGGCVFLCNATGPGHPCCADPACLTLPVCQGQPLPEFPGGFFEAVAEGIAQTPAFCFLDGLLEGVLEALIGGVSAVVELPPEPDYPTLLRLSLPFVGDLNVIARFEDGEVVFDAVEFDPIHLVDFVGFLPPEFQGQLRCVIEGMAAGRTQGLSAGGFGMTVRIFDLVVSPEGPGSACILLGRPANPACIVDVTVHGTRLGQ